MNFYMLPKSLQDKIMGGRRWALHPSERDAFMSYVKGLPPGTKYRVLQFWDGNTKNPPPMVTAKVAADLAIMDRIEDKLPKGATTEASTWDSLTRLFGVYSIRHIRALGKA